MAVILWLAFTVLAVLKATDIIAVSWWVAAIPLYPILAGFVLALLVTAFLYVTSD